MKWLRTHGGNLGAAAGVLVGFFVLRALFVGDAAVFEAARADAVAQRQAARQRTSSVRPSIGAGRTDRGGAAPQDAGPALSAAELKTLKAWEEALAGALHYEPDPAVVGLARPDDDLATRERWQSVKERLYLVLADDPRFPPALVDELRKRTLPETPAHRVAALRGFDLYFLIAQAVQDTGLQRLERFAAERPVAARRSAVAYRSRRLGGAAGGAPDLSAYVQPATVTCAVRGTEPAVLRFLQALQTAVKRGVPHKTLLIKKCTIKKDAPRFLEPPDALVLCELEAVALSIDRHAPFAEAADAGRRRR